jgi:hypothetical protein
MIASRGDSGPEIEVRIRHNGNVWRHYTLTVDGVHRVQADGDDDEETPKRPTTAVSSNF